MVETVESHAGTTRGPCVSHHVYRIIAVDSRARPSPSTMFARTALRTSVAAARPASARLFSQSSAAQRAVAVLGASGGIGQPLSLLLKLNPEVTDLRLYDIRLAPGVAADISHVNTPAKTSGYAPEELEKALEGAEVILIPAGVPRKPGMTRDDLFNVRIC